MDPQQRLLLEVSWEALEHAGQAPDRLAAQRHRRVLRRDQQRLLLPAAQVRRRRAARRPLRLGHRAQRGLRAHLLSARPAGAEHDDRHGLLVVAGGGTPGLPGLRAGECRHGAGRWREPDAVGRPVHCVLAFAHARARRALQDLRRGGRRLRARRGLRRRGAQAPGRRAGRRRPHPGRDPRQRGQPGRAQQRPDRAQRPGPGGSDPRGAGTRLGACRPRSASSRRTAPGRSWATRSRCRRWARSSAQGGMPCIRCVWPRSRRTSATWRPPQV